MFTTGSPRLTRVCVLGAAGMIVAEFVIEHSADRIATLIRRRGRLGDPGRGTSPNRAVGRW
jgi:hypothetical protein